MPPGEVGGARVAATGLGDGLDEREAEGASAGGAAEALDRAGMQEAYESGSPVTCGST